MYVEQERGHEAKYVVEWTTSVINFNARKRDTGILNRAPCVSVAQVWQASGEG